MTPAPCVFISQRFKNLSRPKMHARSCGEVDPLTRQPVQGRARNGGMKVGAMEMACLISHGACAFMRDRMFESSDPYRVHVDARTGLPATAYLRTQEFPAGRDVVQVELPYTMKLLMQELTAMGITPRLEVATMHS